MATTHAPSSAVTILGTGGMGTALALLWPRKGREVRLWGRDPSRVERIAHQRINEDHLPGVRLDPAIVVTADPARALDGATLIVVAVPSAFLGATLEDLAHRAGVPAPQVPVLSVIKGIEPGTSARPTEIVRRVWGQRPLAVLSGPGHAEEMARGLPTSQVVAGDQLELGIQVQEALNSSRLRIYTNDDPIGVELAGALKNVMAIAAGVCEGLGLGDNAKAALITRGLVEIARFAVACGGRRDTFYGLAGVGDLLTTCYSPHGRNRAVGLAVGRGERPETVTGRSLNIAEGVTTCRVVVEMAQRLGIDMPITREVEAVLHHGKPPRLAMSDLLQRLPRTEWWRD